MFIARYALSPYILKLTEPSAACAPSPLGSDWDTFRHTVQPSRQPSSQNFCSSRVCHLVNTYNNSQIIHKSHYIHSSRAHRILYLCSNTATPPTTEPQIIRTGTLRIVARNRVANTSFKKFLAGATKVFVTKPRT